MEVTTLDVFVNQSEPERKPERLKKTVLFIVGIGLDSDWTSRG